MSQLDLALFMALYGALFVGLPALGAWCFAEYFRGYLGWREYLTWLRRRSWLDFGPVAGVWARTDPGIWLGTTMANDRWRVSINTSGMVRQAGRVIIHHP